MYDVAGVPMSFTWEIFGDLEADYADCYKMFNPIDQQTLDATVSNWAQAVLSLVELLPSHPDIAALNLNQTAAPTNVSQVEPKELPEVKATASRERDSSVHGGRNDDLLQSVGDLHDSAADHPDIDGTVHENVLSTSQSEQPGEVPSTVGWVHVLPFVILLLLGIAYRRVRTERTPWLRLKRRSNSVPVKGDYHL